MASARSRQCRRGQNILFDKVLDYPVQAFNYHDRESGPPLAKLNAPEENVLELRKSVEETAL